MNNLPVSVAIIDDDNLYRIMLAKAFERSGLSVIFQAENGKLGIDQMKNCLTLPLVVVVDVEMPVMNGFETTRSVKTNWPEIGIVAHSSISGQDAKDLMIDCGADIFLPKGAGIKELVSTVKQLASIKP